MMSRLQGHYELRFKGPNGNARFPVIIILEYIL